MWRGSRLSIRLPCRCFAVGLRPAPRLAPLASAALLAALSPLGARADNSGAPAAAAPAPGPSGDAPARPSGPSDPGSPLLGFGSSTLDSPGGLASAAAAPRHPLELSAYFTLGGQWLQQNTATWLVGQHNGFVLADARLEIAARPSERFWLFLSFDGAVAQASPADPAQGSRTVALKDAYGIFAPGWHLRLQAGQFKAPQEVEALLDETELKFPTRSIVTEGQHPPAGVEQGGLSLGRQVGVALGTDAIALPFGSLAMQAAVTNGNGPNQLFNDTTSPALSARVALGLFGLVSLGADAYALSRATGTQPLVQYDDLTGFGADVRLRWNGLHLMALVQGRTTKHTTTGAADESALGYSVEAAWLLAGVLEPAVRYSLLDPSDKLPVAKVSELTAALNVYSFGTLGQGVARLSLAYTHRTEEPGRQVANDGFDLAAQLRF
jgi:hypothetical protein